MSKIKSLKYFNEQYQQFIEDMNKYLKGTYNTIVEIFGGGSKRGPLYTLYFTPSNSYWRFLTKRELDNKLLDKLEKIGCGFNVDSDKVTFFIKSNNKKDAFEINGNKNWFRQLGKNEDFKEMLNSIPITFVEVKPFSYKGQIITASSKEEAIKKIVADSKKPKIDMKKL